MRKILRVVTAITLTTLCMTSAFSMLLESKLTGTTSLGDFNVVTTDSSYDIAAIRTSVFKSFSTQLSSVLKNTSKNYTFKIYPIDKKTLPKSCSFTLNEQQFDSVTIVISNDKCQLGY
jgi:hypothetical protein